MIKRSLVLGGLVAGAFLLPSLANAGVVTGSCVNCHTMHNSQNGVNMNGTTTANPQLLKSTGCTGCHASTDENTASGLPAAGTLAPQVDNVLAGTAASFVLNGGFFTKEANISTQMHNVVGVANIADANLTVAPGGAMNTQITCENCHTNSGHHMTVAGTYRMLTGANTTVSAQTDYGAQAVATALVGTRSENQYDATAMNAFCASCHGGFHQSATPESAAGTQRGAVAGTWLRHPTDIVVTNSGTYPSIVTTTVGGSSDAVLLGSNDGTPAIADAGVVMCLSCHVPHGGPYADLLSFNYAAENAGDTTAQTGCEKCHSYAGSGMAGM